MPSALELAGVEKPDHVQFKSLLPLMKRLFASLLKLQKETGDKLDLKTAYPELCGEGVGP